jgi:N-acetylneuraminate synthase
MGNRVIDKMHAPFVIAEVSGNHNQSLDRALAIVDAAADAGAHAIKLQTYTADTMTLDVDGPGFRIEDPGSLWHGETLYQLYEKAHTPWDWHRPLFERARARGLVAFSTPFDETAVDFLEALGVPCYKIASFENTDHALIRRVASTGKPLIMSTGMATIAELDESVAVARAAGCRDLVLLKCTSAYPATAADANLATIPHMRDRFGCEVGLSDHTMGVGVSVAAVALGAVVIEKHFTLSRAEGGVDAAFSLEPSELRSLVAETHAAWQSRGEVSYGPSSGSESGSVQFRRSLYFVRDLEPGESIDAMAVRAIRPGHGLAPKHLVEILGMTAARPVHRGSPVHWDDITSYRRPAEKKASPHEPR